MAKMATNYRVPDDSSSVIMPWPLYCRESKIERMGWMQGDCLSFFEEGSSEGLRRIAVGFQDCSCEIRTYVRNVMARCLFLEKGMRGWVSLGKEVGFVSRRHCVDMFKKKLCGRSSIEV